jgi:hypothetical protein
VCLGIFLVVIRVFIRKQFVGSGDTTLGGYANMFQVIVTSDVGERFGGECIDSLDDGEIFRDDMTNISALSPTLSRKTDSNPIDTLIKNEGSLRALVRKEFADRFKMSVRGVSATLLWKEFDVARMAGEIERRLSNHNTESVRALHSEIVHFATTFEDTSFVGALMAGLPVEMAASILAGVDAGRAVVILRSMENPVRGARLLYAMGDSEALPEGEGRRLLEEVYDLEDFFEEGVSEAYYRRGILAIMHAGMENLLPSLRQDFLTFFEIYQGSRRLDAARGVLREQLDRRKAEVRCSVETSMPDRRLSSVFCESVVPEEASTEKQIERRNRLYWKDVVAGVSNNLTDELRTQFSIETYSGVLEAALAIDLVNDEWCGEGMFDAERLKSFAGVPQQVVVGGMSMEVNVDTDGRVIVSPVVTKEFSEGVVSLLANFDKPVFTFVPSEDSFSSVDWNPEELGFRVVWEDGHAEYKAWEDFGIVLDDFEGDLGSLLGVITDCLSARSL